MVCNSKLLVTLTILTTTSHDIMWYKNLEQNRKTQYLTEFRQHRTNQLTLHPLAIKMEIATNKKL